MEHSIKKKLQIIDKPVISVNNISVNFEDNEIIKNLSFQIKEGEKAVITGESGKGKSTILNTLLGFIPISKGEIYLFDKQLSIKNLTEIRSQTAWLPQETALHFESVNHIIYTLFTFKANKSKYPSKSKINHLLNSLNLLPELLNKEIDEISGGQKQRLLLASVLLLNKKLLIVDEPTSSLDEKNKKLVTDLILSQKDLTVLSTSHDPYWIQQSDKIIAL